LIRKSQKKQEPGSPGAPAYIVTFSDMVTLLLTFFVMLLSMADMQDPELFNTSRDAFINHINCYGLGMLSGKQMSPQFQQPKDKHYIDSPDEDAALRTLDSEEEKLRRLFDKVVQNAETMPTQLTSRNMDFTVTNVFFEKGQAKLNNPGRDFLDGFIHNMQNEVRSGEAMLYVLGLAGDGRSAKVQWTLSAQRAQNVADYLTANLYDNYQCPIYAWGGGPGGHWVGEDSPAHKDSHILIAILRAERY
jgi:chemotaxis protein MotB